MMLPLVIALAMVAIILPPVLKWKENKLAVVVFYMLVLTQAFIIWYVVPLLPHFSSHLGPAQAFCISLISALVLSLVFGGLLRQAKGAACCATIWMRTAAAIWILKRRPVAGL